MNVIGNRIKYLPATSDPLSADVYCIEGDKYCYVYDVGNDDRSLQYINQIGKEKIVVLSHHHKDHTGNIVGLHYRDLYVGKKTYEVIGKGIIVENMLTLNDGVRIDVSHCISPHTEGSLIITVDNEYRQHSHRTLAVNVYSWISGEGEGRLPRLLFSLPSGMDFRYSVSPRWAMPTPAI